MQETLSYQERSQAFLGKARDLNLEIWSRRRKRRGVLPL